MKKRNLIVLVVCALFVLVAILFMASGPGGPPGNQPTNAGVVITSDGQVLVPQQTRMSVTFSVTATNTPLPATNR